MQRLVPGLRSVFVCLILTGVAYWLTLLLWPYSERFPFAFFLAAVLASAWICGPLASLGTTVFCTAALSGIYYWQAPASGLELVQENFPRMGLFLFTGLLTSYLVRECRGAIQAVDRVHLMLGNLGEALVTTDTQGMVRYINQEAQTLTGCDGRDVVGKPLGHVLTLQDEQTRQPLPQVTQSVLARRVAIDLPAGVVLQSPAGKKVAVEGRAAPIADGERIDGVALTFRDVTRRRKDERGLKHKLEQWRSAAQVLPDPVFVKDELGNYVGANDAAARLVARMPAEIAGAEDAALFSPEVARAIVQADRDAFESGQPQTYQLAVGEGEERRVFEAIKTPLVGPEGKLTGLVDVFREKTRAALGEEKHKKAIRDLERRLEEQTAAHKNAEQRQREAYEKELTVRKDESENSLNAQLDEMRRLLDEKTADHAETQALLNEATQAHASELENHSASARSALERDFESRLEKLKADHALELKEAVALEQQRGDELIQLAQQEQARAVAEYQSAWEASEEALQRAKTELDALRSRPAQPEENGAMVKDREALIQRLAEQTAARLGLEESLSRAQERHRTMKDELDQAARQNPEQLEEIRRQAAAEHEQKWNQAQVDWQHRLVQNNLEHERRLQTEQAEWQQELERTRRDQEEHLRSVQENWRQTMGEYDRRLTEARNHTAENERLREQLEESRQSALHARREKERLEELLNSRPIPSTNGKSADGKTAYEAWEDSMMATDGDWLSFN